MVQIDAGRQLLLLQLFLDRRVAVRGVDVLFEQHSARHTDFRTGEKLGARDHVVQWSKPLAKPAWMTAQEYAAYPAELTLREVKVRRTGRRVAASAELQAYGAGVGRVESKAVPLRRSRRHGCLVPVDCPHPSR